MDDVIIIYETINIRADGEPDFPELTDEEIKVIQERFAAIAKKK